MIEIDRNHLLSKGQHKNNKTVADILTD